MAREVLQYRVARQDTAAQNARKNNFDGLMFPWESAFTGSEVDPAPETKIEEHIQVNACSMSPQDQYRHINLIEQ